MDDGSKEAVVKQIAKYAMALVKGLKGVKAKRDEDNLPRDEEHPPVLPHELVKMRHALFIDNVLNKHRNRLLVTCTEEQVEDIESEHRELIKLYCNNEAVRKALDKHDMKTLFNDAWDSVPGCKRLRAFCGGLATVFPNMTSVESDFSILKWEHGEFRSSLVHLWEEGVMQAKQQSLLKQLRE